MTVTETEGQDTDLDEIVPLVGTGQGDLQMVPQWQNVTHMIAFRKRHKAMITAYEDEADD